MPPPPKTGQGKGKPGFKSKGEFEKDMIERSTKKDLASQESKEPAEESSESP